jgi:ribosomal protein S18 acetylase RimI-like enzyme
MIRVDRITVDDVGRVLAAAALFDRPPRDAALHAFLADPATFLLLASVDDAPAGFARGVRLRRPDTERPQLFLYEIGVAESRRRLGVGSALIRGVLAIAREQRCLEVFVLADPANEPALALYRSTGGVAETSLMYVYDLR